MSGNHETDYLKIAGEWEGAREAHAYAASLAAHFRDASAVAVVRMWETGNHWKTGKPLSNFEAEALVERWCELFDRLPPSDGGMHLEPEAEPVPLNEHPLLSVPDDAMLRPRDVDRLLGYAKSTRKRDIKAGKFPMPQRIAPGKRHIGWPARQR